MDIQYNEVQTALLRYINRLEISKAKYLKAEEYGNGRFVIVEDIDKRLQIAHKKFQRSLAPLGYA